MSDEWFYVRQGNRRGPVSSDQLIQLAETGGLYPADFVWREGMSDWVTADKVPDLFNTGVKPAAGVPPVVASEPLVADEANAVESTRGGPSQSYSGPSRVAPRATYMPATTAPVTLVAPEPPIVRPTSISVIAWLFIVGSFVSAINLFLNEDNIIRLLSRNSNSVSTQLAIQYEYLGVQFVCGIGLLSGRNWARILYLGNVLIAYILALATTRLTLLGFGVLVAPLFGVAIIAAFLFRPSANRYFLGKTQLK